MLRFLLNRLLTAIPTLLIIATLAFALLHATPGGPFDSAKRMPPAIQASIEARYHLDEPLWRQYARYLGDLAHGDLGPSFQYRDTSVNSLIRQGLPVDATIGVCALLLALLAGGASGILAALHRNGARDHALMFVASLGISLPTFVIGPLLILVFAVQLHWLPSGDWVAGSIGHLILPVVALALPYTAYIARMVRGAAIEVFASPFIRTARAKGLPRHTVILRHALRPILTPLVSFLGPAFAGVLTGSIVIESVFGLPGIGRYFVTGAVNRDYTLVVGITILYGVLIIAFNLLADLCYAWLDPRVRLHS
ncbi:MAG TPA: oligopeptide ABC transporter permease OppB [Steroidobacteraceae bacterium]|nr:oligopeptide ABC transporter permease OppB [Steroidobacteraceae bacterium]